MSAATSFIALLGQAAAAREASMKRLRAVPMTPMLAALGLLPMVLFHDVGTETQRPLPGLSAGLRHIDVGEARACGRGTITRHSRLRDDTMPPTDRMSAPLMRPLTGWPLIGVALASGALTIEQGLSLLEGRADLKSRPGHEPWWSWPVPGRPSSPCRRRGWPAPRPIPFSPGGSPRTHCLRRAGCGEPSASGTCGLAPAAWQAGLRGEQPSRLLALAVAGVAAGSLLMERTGDDGSIGRFAIGAFWLGYAGLVALALLMECHGGSSSLGRNAWLLILPCALWLPVQFDGVLLMGLHIPGGSFAEAEPAKFTIGIGIGSGSGVLLVGVATRFDAA